jgi:hypothetical protein
MAEEEPTTRRRVLRRVRETDESEAELERSVVSRCLTVKENCIILLVLLTMLGLELFRFCDENLQLRGLTLVLDYINKTTTRCSSLYRGEAAAAAVSTEL